MRTAVVAAGCGALIIYAALAGCATSPPPVAPASLVGETLDLLSEGAGVHATLLVQDASPRIGEKPSYDGDTDRDGDWVIVAICTSDENVETSSEVEVAVLPLASVSESVQDDVAAGRYRDAVDCAGRPFHG